MKELILNIRDVNSTGQGVALSEEGKVIFVDGALPGERVLVSMVQEKKNYGRGKLVEIEVASENRVEPRCPLFGSCGGCQIQHGSYELQISIKREIVKSAMERIGGIKVDYVDCVPSERQWGYRNKASFPIRAGKNGGIGYFRSQSHIVVPVEQCPVLSEKINHVYSMVKNNISSLPAKGWMYDETKSSGFLRHAIIRSNEQQEAILMFVVAELNKGKASCLKDFFPEGYDDKLISLALNINGEKGNRIIGDKTVPLWGKNLITEQMGDFSLSYDGTAFFQVNTPQAEKLFKLVSDWTDGYNDRIVELYSGVGSLTAYLSKRAGSVLAVEEWAPSVERLRENMTLNNIKNVTSICGRAESLIEHMLKEKPKVVVVDPPRTGCDVEVLSSVTESTALKLIYVSCNPATLARDSAFLIKSGWNFEKVQSFDLFPQTCHVETVICFTR